MAITNPSLLSWNGSLSCSYLLQPLYISAGSSSPIPNNGRPPNLKKTVYAEFSEFDIAGSVRLLRPVVHRLHQPIEEETSFSPDRYDQHWTDPRSFLQSTFISDNVRRVIGSFSAGFGTGIDGLRPQHLKDYILFTAGNAGLGLLENLSHFIICSRPRVSLSTFISCSFGPNYLASPSPTMNSAS